MNKLLTILFCSLFAISVQAQTVIIVQAQTVIISTNGVPAPEPDPANPVYYLYGSAGSFRLNVRATDGVGGIPLNMNDIQNSGQFVLSVKDISDNKIIYTINADSGGDDNDASLGQRRFTIPSLDARTYELKAVAIPQAGTNQQYVIHWGYLTVTNVPSDVIDASSALNIYQTFPMTTQTLSVVTVDQSTYLQAGGTSVSLPSAGASTNAVIVVKNIDGNGNVQVDAQAGDWIEYTSATLLIGNKGATYQLVSDGGTNWVIQ